MITKEDVRNAYTVLERYRNLKVSLDNRILENRRVWRKLTGSAAGAQSETDTKNTTAWLFNLVANRHADAIDSYPEAIITGREEGDIGKAKALSDILPIICEHNGFERLWSELWWSKLIDGTCVTGVFWDNSMCRGLGDIALRQVDMLSIYWDFGVTDLQKSRNVFTVESVLNEELTERYPFVEGKLTSGKLTSFLQDTPDDGQERSTVIDWYYKKNGKLHFCKFTGEEILYSSENDIRFAERGWYDHGKYPFVFDSMYPYCNSIYGFGVVDVCKNPQKYIDKLNSAIVRNAINCSKVRYFVRSDGGVNEQEFADTDNELIHVSSSALGEDSIRQVTHSPLSGIYPTVLKMKIDELKETGGNRDFNSGGTYGGVVSGTAITALQEAGNKLSRDVISESYRAFEEVNYLMIELIRQFYTKPRAFRIIGRNGRESFIKFGNSELTGVVNERIYGLESVMPEPIFDVKVFAQKASPASREVKNERAMQLYNAGFFRPEMAEQAISALEMMDFEGREKVIGIVSDSLEHAQREVRQLPIPLLFPGDFPKRSERGK